MRRVGLKIGLVHNDDASDAVSMTDLARTIARHGHQVIGVAHPSDGLAPLELDQLDLVAAAGGDGTIAATAGALAGLASTTPLAVLPMGTANNIALTLGVPAGIDDAIAAWQRATPRPFDLGVATGPWGERQLVESLGGGLVTHGIVVMERRDYTSPTPAAQLARARHAHADVLQLLAPYAWRLALDERPVEGDFLFVEVMNIPTIGPNLMLTTAASPWDGRFTVVAATPDHREGSPPGCATAARWPRSTTCSSGTPPTCASRSATACTSTTT
jgi:diacylglycerol kinase (ATP)